MVNLVCCLTALVSVVQMIWRYGSAERGNDELQLQTSRGLRKVLRHLLGISEGCYVEREESLQCCKCRAT
jgi:hypothetical protein